MNPHIVVVSYGGPLAGDPSLVERTRAVAGVVAAEPFVYGQAMIAVGRSAAGVVVRGIDPQMAGAVVDLERHLENGTLAALATPHPITLPPEEGGTKVELPGLLIGAELARQLGVGTGDVVNLISPLGTPGPAGVVPRMKRFVVAGLFDSGMFDYDTTLAYMALPDAQRFFDLKRAVTGIEVRARAGRLLAPRAPPVPRAAEGRLPGDHAAGAVRPGQLRGRGDGFDRDLRPRRALPGPAGGEPGPGRSDPL